MEQAQLQFLLVTEGRSGFGDDSLVNKSYVDAVANGLDVKASVELQLQETLLQHITTVTEH